MGSIFKWDIKVLILWWKKWQTKEKLLRNELLKPFQLLVIFLRVSSLLVLFFAIELEDAMAI